MGEDNVVLLEATIDYMNDGVGIEGVASRILGCTKVCLDFERFENV